MLTCSVKIALWLASCLVI